MNWIDSIVVLSLTAVTLCYCRCGIVALLPIICILIATRSSAVLYGAVWTYLLRYYCCCRLSSYLSLLACSFAWLVFDWRHTVAYFVGRLDALIILYIDRRCICCWPVPRSFWSNDFDVTWAIDSRMIGTDCFFSTCTLNALQLNVVSILFSFMLFFSDFAWNSSVF